MDWKIAAELFMLAPFAFVAIPFLVADTARLVASVRRER